MKKVKESKGDNKISELAIAYFVEADLTGIFSKLSIAEIEKYSISGCSLSAIQESTQLPMY